MDPERFALAQSLFDEVVDLEAPLQAQRLRELTDDPALAEYILALARRADGKESGFAFRVARAADVISREPVTAGETLGVWRVVREIGRGGMGSVFLVERSDGHFRQSAALKILKGLARPEGLAYFTRERQLLASLAHPNIARLLDGGATAEGEPYLVMEFVDGAPIDVYCREKGLSVPAILGLFVTACAAVAFAHQRLIVHCDLKPSNLLVNAEGRPILLDFGIARLLDGGGEDREVDGVAAPATAAFTPRYASPEQASRGRIATSSDIYSLGVMLAELLGAPSMAGMASITDPELRALVSRATAADPSLRYATVDALCQDIERFLEGRPVEAMPPSASYRLRKFVVRRWPAVLGVCLFVLTVAVFTVRVIMESRRARAAEAAATAERDRAVKAESAARAAEASAREVSAFLTSVFGGSNPDARTGNIPTAVLLEQAFERVERDLKDQPGTQAQMYAALAGVLDTIEQPKRALETYEKAIAIERTQRRPLVLARMLMDLALVRQKHFDGRDMITDAREALSLVDRYGEPDSLMTLDAVLSLARAVGTTGDPREASALHERSVALARRIVPGSRKLAIVMGAAAWHHRRLKEYDLAIAMMREQIALFEKVTDVRDPEYLAALETLAGTLGLARRFDEAEAAFTRTIEVRKATGTLDTSSGAWTLAELARMLTEAGRPLEAIPVYREVLSIGERKVADDGASRGVWLGNLGTAAARAGRADLAEASYRESIVILSRIWERGGLALGRTFAKSARGLLDLGRSANAGPWIVSGRDALIAKLPKESPEALEVRILYAQWRFETKHADDARTELALVTPSRSLLMAEPAARLTRLEGLLAIDAGQMDEGLRMLERAEAGMRAALGQKDARSFLIALDRAEALRAHGRRSEAAALATAILQGIEGKVDPAAPWISRLRRLL
ncbi:MAG: tetratricopeptide repeat protein [Vicinamibacteria bacterium]|nr:tetratricopeptide repeat protein [Vicinamibacteria bacterium]